MSEADYDIRNYADRARRQVLGRATRTLQDLHNTSYHTKSTFNDFLSFNEYISNVASLRLREILSIILPAPRQRI